MGEFSVGGLRLHTPVMNAAGTMGFGASYADYFDLNELGALVTRSVTLSARGGNPAPRLYEAPSGILHSVGFQNPGIDVFSLKFYKGLSALNIPVILSLYGTAEEISAMCGKIAPLERIAAVTVNAFVTPECYYALGEQAYYDALSRQVEACRCLHRPVWVKLMPMAGDIVLAARAAQRAGAQAAVCCNAFWAASVDGKTGRSRLSKSVCGLSGPGIKPIAQYLAARVARETSLDVIGCGGIMDAEDAKEYLALGAKAVAVGTASFVEPESAARIARALEKEDFPWN